MLSVIKADGTKEPFSEEKIISSIHNAGISDKIQTQVIDHIKSKLYEGISTKEIYHHITEFLGATEEPFHKTRYSLKQAIMNLGPTGYPFEDYVAKILELEGYQTSVRQVLQGICVSHEIDIIATKNTVMPTKIMVEAKFHNAIGIKTDIHVPMYTKSRFEDIKDKHNITGVLLVTNTKATIDASAFADCVKMEIITWSYPEGRSLRSLVEKYQLFPVTALDTLPQNEKQKLLQNGIVLCKDLCKNQEVIEQMDLPKDKKGQILKEASFVCSIV